MTTNLFGNKKIAIRRNKKSDTKTAKKFMAIINSLIEEDAKISRNQKVTLEEEKAFLKGSARNKNEVNLVAECDDEIVGFARICLEKGRLNHIGTFGIFIKSSYRGVGLGKYLMSEIIKLAKKELYPKLKIIQLGVIDINKPALNLYKKMGFKRVAKLPKQLQYKKGFVTEIVMNLEV